MGGIFIFIFIKVHLFWEGHKNLRNLLRKAELYLGQNVPPDNCGLWISKTEIVKPPNFFTDSGKVRGYCPVHWNRIHIWKTRKASYQHKYIHRKTKFFSPFCGKKLKNWGEHSYYGTRKQTTLLVICTNTYVSRFMTLFVIQLKLSASDVCHSGYFCFIGIFKKCLGLFTFLV